ncbi:hypothetical protein BBK36DRAFT_1155749 [Trichoderma citrinoviride]|uniref:Uncharacterized protein n=1 Tax=Trichoderma citrinoviride TaxID=58853 RepID=A0A2T4BNS9_9HYPO|nr:hypothetical protein BBK36DRAFT_1155749 [Trichoderma citrinoviride]PTB70967.1 hypothetical protein BBK36DRAFT_1155749 [Trichoderma citrinoviride]
MKLLRCLAEVPVTSPSHTTVKMIESCSKPTNFGRGAYDTTGLPKPPPPQPQ